MNLLLLPSQVQTLRLPPDDPRLEHILKVLGKRVGETLDVGAVNGPRGKATLQRDNEERGYHLDIVWQTTPPALLPIQLLTPFPRPQTARRILQDGTALGIGAFHFFPGAKAELSYSKASIWQNKEYEDYLKKGAAQAFSTWIPKVTLHPSLEAALESCSEAELRMALDIYEATAALRPASEVCQKPATAALALGGERGWAKSERQSLAQSGFQLVHMGSRILRTETAMAAAMGIILHNLNWWGDPREAIPKD